MEQPLWFWLTEPLPMDFANTVRRRGMVDHDYLRTGADLASWSEREAGRGPRGSARAAAARLEEVRAVRDDVKAVLRAAADDAPLPARATARLNALARSWPLVAQLGRRPGERHTAPATPCGALDELLARVAAATIELVGSGGSDVVGFCAVPACRALL